MFGVNRVRNVPRVGDSHAGTSAGGPAGDAGSVDVRIPIAMETFLGGSDSFWGSAGTLWSWISVDDGRIWVVDKEAMTFANDCAEEGNSLWKLVG